MLKECKDNTSLGHRLSLPKNGGRKEPGTEPGTEAKIMPPQNLVSAVSIPGTWYHPA